MRCTYRLKYAGDEDADAAINRMLERLGLDYIDLLYVHQPMGNWRGAWRAMERAVAPGKVRSLGLSNFDAADSLYTAAMEWAEIKPAVMQIECHPYAQRKMWMKKLANNSIVLEAWFPLGGAMSNGALFKDPTLMKIAEAHGKTPAQIILRWHIQESHSTIPGATYHPYISENISTFDFELTPEEMDEIRSLYKEQRFFNMDYKEAEQFMINWKIDDRSMKPEVICHIMKARTNQDNEKEHFRKDSGSSRYGTYCRVV